jgi:hypothetical protein
MPGESESSPDLSARFHGFPAADAAAVFGTGAGSGARPLASARLSRGEQTLAASIFATMEAEMKTDKLLREHLLQLLSGGGAHVDFDAAVKGLPPELRGVKAKDSVHSAWELLEHLRIAQWDIVEFTQNESHVSPDFPSGYWPPSPVPPDDAAWELSVGAFREDLLEMKDLVKDESINLFKKIPHGEGQTVLREALLLADHNAYHIGEIVMLRKILGAWNT